MFRFVVIVSALVCAAAFAPRASVARASSLSMANIVETAIGAGSFKTLVAAVQAAGLVDMLSGPADGEKWHVFAPTDEAFAKLPAGTVEALLADKEKLTAILAFHCVSEEDQKRGTRVKTIKEMTYKNGNSFVTASGKEIQVKVKNGDVYMVGGTYGKVTTANIACDNGFINIVDTVILPYEGKVPSIFDVKIE
jgi:uncharacterized surface protein with fasciclin (FAS1) repeats